MTILEQLFACGATDVSLERRGTTWPAPYRVKIVDYKITVYAKSADDAARAALEEKARIDAEQAAERAARDARAVEGSARLEAAIRERYSIGTGDEP